jgi:hypothetical protein
MSSTNRKLGLSKDECGLVKDVHHGGSVLGSTSNGSFEGTRVGWVPCWVFLEKLGHYGRGYMPSYSRYFKLWYYASFFELEEYSTYTKD